MKNTAVGIAALCVLLAALLMLRDTGSDAPVISSLDDSSIEARFQLARFALRAGNDQEARRLLGTISTIEATLGRGPREEE